MCEPAPSSVCVWSSRCSPCMGSNTSSRSDALGTKCLRFPSGDIGCRRRIQTMPGSALSILLFPSELLPHADYVWPRTEFPSLHEMQIPLCDGEPRTFICGIGLADDTNTLPDGREMKGCASLPDKGAPTEAPGRQQQRSGESHGEDTDNRAAQQTQAREHDWSREDMTCFHSLEPAQILSGAEAMPTRRWVRLRPTFLTLYYIITL